jgi:hypothetical protein
VVVKQCKQALAWMLRGFPRAETESDNVLHARIMRISNRRFTVTIEIFRTRAPWAPKKRAAEAAQWACRGLAPARPVSARIEMPAGVPFAGA